MDICLKFVDPIAAQGKFVLGDLWRSRVVVLNDDKFPQRAENLQNRGDVIIKFVQHNYLLFRGKVHAAFFWQLAPGISFVIDQFITQYAIKTVTLAYNIRSNGGDTGPYQSYITTLGCLYFCNFLLEYFADVKFTRLRLGGAAAKHMRGLCMDTVIQLSPSSQEIFDVGRVMKTSEVAVDGAIGASWMQCFDLYANLVKLICMILFIMYTAYAQAKLSRTPALLLLIVVPFAMLALDFILLQMSIRTAAVKDLEAMHADDEWSSFMVQAAFLRSVITTYRKGYAVTERFGMIHDVFNKKAFDADKFTNLTKWNAGAIPTACAAVVMIIVGTAVENGQMTVPAYVTFMSTISSFSPTLGAVITDLFTIGKGYANIVKVAHLLNADTRRKQLLRGQRRREKLIANLPANTVDLEALFLHDVTYRFDKMDDAKVPPLRCHIDGGQVVALRGGGSVGKKLVLRLMARHFIPTTGFVHYPKNWRFRFLDANPNFFGGDMNKLQMAAMEGERALTAAQQSSMGTLDYNLKFGSQFKHPDHDVWNVEIYNLLKLLKISEDLIGRSVEEYVETSRFAMTGLDGEKLSMTNKALLSIARALLSSVDILFMSNVLDSLGPVHAQHVMGILKDWTRNRCVDVLSTENSTTPVHLRKKKTVIFSTKLKELEAMADNWMFLGTNDAESEKSDASEGEPLGFSEI